MTESWPTYGPAFNTWYEDAAKFLKIVQEHPNLWLENTQLKYLGLRVDTRAGGHFTVQDRDGHEISADDVMRAVRELSERGQRT